MYKNLSVAERKDLITRSRCFAEISLPNLRHNLNEVKRFVRPGTKICGVVKADAYGHGPLEIARALAEAGVRYLAVSCLGEALELKEAGIPQTLFILGPNLPEAAPILQEFGLRQALTSEAEALAYSRYLDPDLPDLKFHLKLDTGMSRHGFRCINEAQEKASLAAIARVAQLPKIKLEGVFTHFATASDDGNALYDEQIACFQRTVAALSAQGQKFELIHCANSASILVKPELDYNLVRAGIILYGGRDEDYFRAMTDLKPVMTLKARLSACYELEAGDHVSYGATYTAERRMRIGVVECGYADGLLRNLSGKAVFSLHGQAIQQIGRICMDRCMVDLSNAPQAQAGEYVTIFGGQGSDFVDAAEQAARAGTISYELFSLVSKRVPRIYID
ncbi:MAG: alanine racemase [Eubacteriales bacterium]|nr:alanine racemase [Eubacteriales bacterium]